jgi:hypothetical protein
MSEPQLARAQDHAASTKASTANTRQRTYMPVPSWSSVRILRHPPAALQSDSGAPGSGARRRVIRVNQAANTTHLYTPGLHHGMVSQVVHHMILPRLFMRKVNSRILTLIHCYIKL